MNAVETILKNRLHTQWVVLWLIAALLLLFSGCGTSSDSENSSMDDGGDYDYYEEYGNDQATVGDGDSDSPGISDPEGPLSPADNDKGTAYAPMLSDPAQLTEVFGEELQSSNIDYGQSLPGSFEEQVPFVPYTFDALAGARVTISLQVATGEADPVLYLYGPKSNNGLWGDALAVNDDYDDSINALIFDFPISRSGSYLILATRLALTDEAAFELSLGCRNLCQEPVCPDLTCQGYCNAGLLSDSNGCTSCQCSGSTSSWNGGNLEDPCSSDDDCNDELICLEGFCADVEAPYNPCECPGIYDPVCGQDGITYANACEAECYGNTTYSAGECEIDGGCTFDSDCPVDEFCVDGFCTAPAVGCGCEDEEPFPVCGEDGISYPSACEAACVDVEIWYEGDCDCRPVCATDGQGWQNSCTLMAINSQNCEGCQTVCRNGGTDSEGWYSNCDNSLLELADCTSGCGCPEVWQPVCGEDGVTYENLCQAQCAGASMLYSGECDFSRVGCQSDDDCPSGYLCDLSATDCVSDPTGCGGICILPNEAFACISDLDCPEGQVCEFWYGSAQGICSEATDSQSCQITGCHGELCLSYPTGSSCNTYQPEFACLAFTSCEAVNGSCGWQALGPEYDQCMTEIANAMTCTVDRDCMDTQFCLRGVCTTSECVCPTESAPICGNDGNSYDNACLAICAGVQVLHEDACP